MIKRRRIDIWRERGAYCARFTFDWDLLDFFRSLPTDDRTFNRETKTWNFAEEHLFHAVQTSRQLGFDDVIVWPDGQAPPRPKSTKRKSSPPVGSEDAVEQAISDFFKLVPRVAMQSAYRRAAAMLHPDVGGNTADMQRLNALWARIEREFYGQK